MTDKSSFRNSPNSDNVIEYVRIGFKWWLPWQLPPHSLITSWHVGTEEVCLELIRWKTAETMAVQPFDMELQKWVFSQDKLEPREIKMRQEETKCQQTWKPWLFMTAVDDPDGRCDIVIPVNVTWLADMQSHNEVEKMTGKAGCHQTPAENERKPSPLPFPLNHPPHHPPT